jgi:mannose-6-phosphate isomerase-like protein (cupin superfamily)
MSLEQPDNRMTWRRPPTPYELYMDEQGVPVYRGIFGVRDVRDLALGDWRRMGGRGAFIELEAIGGIQSFHVLEVPAGKTLNKEHHLFEEIVLVIEGSGTTEVWWTDGGPIDSFDWRQNGLFTIPLNSWHTFRADSSGPALLLVATNAAPIMQMFQNRERFIFDNTWQFHDRYCPGESFFEPWAEVGIEPLSGRGLYAAAHLPDAVNLPLPLDGQRGWGYRHAELFMSGNFYTGFIGEYPSGRYSKTHAHQSGPVLVCLRGSGYTLAWPRSAGPTPWKDGKEDQVVRVEYQAGGLVSAAPGGGDWFHAHFGVSKEPMRVLAHSGGYARRTEGAPGDVIIDFNEDIRNGGGTIGYADEDPMVKKIFVDAIGASGVEFAMDEQLYHLHP